MDRVKKTIFILFFHVEGTGVSLKRGLNEQREKFGLCSSSRAFSKQIASVRVFLYH